MPYSDKDLQVATQIAYYDFGDDLKNLLGAQKEPTLSNLLRQANGKDSNKYHQLETDLENALKEGNVINADRAKQSMRLYDEILSGKSPYSDWKIADVCDRNGTTGFYACVIETDENSAIVGFRGSESNDLHDVITDWGEADLALLNGTLTGQQADATAYMRKVNGMDYQNFATTGHSLGGNLSDHATLTAPNSLKSRISQSVNFDGPGFSDEYIRLHKNDILQMRGTMTHYQWSVVGALLFPLPGVSYESVLTRPIIRNRDDIKSMAFKHDTGFLQFDKNGGLLPGEPDTLAETMADVSRAIDGTTQDSPPLRCLLFVLMDNIDQLDNLGAVEFLKAIGGGFSAVGRLFTYKPKSQLGNAVRDFSNEALSNFQGIAREVDGESPFQFTRWDIWYRVENLFGGLNLENYDGNTNAYYRKIIDVNGISAAKIKEIFEEVQTIDSTYSGKLRTFSDTCQAIQKSIVDLSSQLIM